MIIIKLAARGRIRKVIQQLVTMKITSQRWRIKEFLLNTRQNNMKTTLKTEITIKEICKGFVYNELEGKGLFGLSGKLTIQPEYQRNYIYAEEGKEDAVIESIL